MSVKEQIIKSNCRGCHSGCGVLVHVNDRRITKVEGDSDFPTNHGTSEPPLSKKGSSYTTSCSGSRVNPLLHGYPVEFHQA